MEKKAHEEMRMKQRALWHDYRKRGIYMLTLVVDNREPLLGRLVGDWQDATGKNPVRIERSPLGRKVAAELEGLVRFFPMVKIIKKVVMPNHVHVILFVTEDMEKHLGGVVRGFKAGCTKELKERVALAVWGVKSPLVLMGNEGADNRSGQDARGNDNRSAQVTRGEESNHEPNNTGRIDAIGMSDQDRVQLQAVFRHAMERMAGYSPTNEDRRNRRKKQNLDCRVPNFGTWQAYDAWESLALFEEGYHDRVLSGNGQLEHMVRYVDENPWRLAVKVAQPDIFAKKWSVTAGGYSFVSLGNYWLLRQPMKAVHVRRIWTEEQKRAYHKECLDAAEKGTVLIGAFISPYEKAIYKEAMDEEFPVIKLVENVFGQYETAWGNEFYAAVRHRLLLLAPWEHHVEHRTIQRQQCVALNTMAETIAASMEG